MKVRPLQDSQALSIEQLKALPTRRLFHHFKMARAKVSYIYHHYGRRCCEICCEYIGDDWQGDVVDKAKPWEDYLKIVKAELNSRHDQFSHRLTKPKSIVKSQHENRILRQNQRACSR